MVTRVWEDPVTRPKTDARELTAAVLPNMAPTKWAPYHEGRTLFPVEITHLPRTTGPLPTGWLQRTPNESTLNCMLTSIVKATDNRTRLCNLLI